MEPRLAIRWSALALLGSLALAAGQGVEIRDNEVWTVRNGEAKQLTHDGKAKVEAILSPSGTRIAYYDQCPQGEDCLPDVVILDLEGKRLKSFRPVAGALPPAERCASILNLYWLGENAVAVECHLNPSVSEYVETDLATGKTTRDLLGLGFAPSPDGKYIAHVGPITHFAPRFRQSYYLLMDKVTVYPLPPGWKPSEKEPDVVRNRGSGWFGIHEVVPRFSWSPDSQRVAFVDCTLDWIERGIGADGATPIGDETNRRCSVAVVSRTGQFSLFPISRGAPGCESEAMLSWEGPRQVTSRICGAVRKFGIP